MLRLKRLRSVNSRSTLKRLKSPALSLEMSDWFTPRIFPAFACVRFCASMILWISRARSAFSMARWASASENPTSLNTLPELCLIFVSSLIGLPPIL